MKGGLSVRGFTIIETLIVLAVTGGMLVIAITFIGGRQNRTQFAQGMRDMESRLQQVIGDVSNGYYPNDGNFKCQGAASPVLTPGGSTEQGANKECIFLGKAVQFAVDAADSPTFNVYSIVGLREKPSGGSVGSLSEAQPRLIARGTSDPASVPDIFDTGQLRYGITVSPNGMLSNGNPIGAVGFVGRLGAQLGADDTSQQVDLLAFTATSLGQSAPDAIDDIKNNLRAMPASAVNPNSGVTICLNSNGSQQSGLISIGGAGRKLLVTVTMKETLNCV